MALGVKRHSVTRVTFFGYYCNTCNNIIIIVIAEGSQNIHVIVVTSFFFLRRNYDKKNSWNGTQRSSQN
jgi:hypothetical protein